MQNMPDKIIQNSLKEIEEAQISLKNQKTEFENERKEDKERGRERSVVMLSFESYQIYRTSQMLKEGAEKYQEALEKKGKKRIDLTIEAIEILDKIGFYWSQEISKDALRHVAMIEYMAFRAGFFQAIGRIDTWLKTVSKEELVRTHKKAKESKELIFSGL